jgi:hypothetical protein
LRVDQHDVGRLRPGPGARQPGVPRRQGLDDERHPEPHEPQILGGLAAVQLGTLQARAADDVDHPLRRLVPEDADGQRVVRQALDDVAHHLRVDLPGTGREHEADGVRPHGDRQQCIVLVGHPADLDEHGFLRRR